MKLTYSQGQVFFEGTAKGFEISYSGNMEITNSDDNLLIFNSKSKIIGIMFDGNNLPNELFTYSGKIRVIKCTVSDGETLYTIKIESLYTDKFNIDKSKWEDDTADWASSEEGNHKYRSSRFKGMIGAVNNNIQVREGEWKYKDGSLVEKGSLIHIHTDGIAMSGGVHNEDSVRIYPGKEIQYTRQHINKIRKQVGISSTERAANTGTSGGGY